MITPEQLRAAKAILDWSFEILAQKTEMTGQGLMNIASGKTKPQTGTSNKIASVLQDHGIELLDGGARLAPKKIEVVEGADCYMQTLNRAMLKLMDSDNKDLLIMFASDAVSPPEVNAKYRFMREHGITMRQLIKEGDTYIMGDLNEYRTIPEPQFVNVVSLIYADCVAQVNGDETAVTIYNDAKLAKQKRTDFEERWQKGAKPESSTATERF